MRPTNTAYAVLTPTEVDVYVWSLGPWLRAQVEADQSYLEGGSTVCEVAMLVASQNELSAHEEELFSSAIRIAYDKLVQHERRGWLEFDQLHPVRRAHASLVSVHS